MQQSKELQVVRRAVGFMREPVGQNIDWSGIWGPQINYHPGLASGTTLQFKFSISPSISCRYALKAIAVYSLDSAEGGGCPRR